MGVLSGQVFHLKTGMRAQRPTNSKYLVKHLKGSLLWNFSFKVYFLFLYVCLILRQNNGAVLVKPLFGQTPWIKAEEEWTSLTFQAQWWCAEANILNKPSPKHQKHKNSIYCTNIKTTVKSKFEQLNQGCQYAPNKIKDGMSAQAKRQDCSQNALLFLCESQASPPGADVIKQTTRVATTVLNSWSAASANMPFNLICRILEP